MELTISQIGSALPQNTVRHLPVASLGVRDTGANQTKTVYGVPATPVAALGDMETEYDQFGRFGASAAAPPDAGEDASAPRSGINPTKHFRAGHVTISELDQEYARSMLGLTLGPDDGSDIRRFIPSGMTEYQVHQLYDFQYRWAIEVERQALARQDLEKTHAGGPAGSLPAGDATGR